MPTLNDVRVKQPLSRKVTSTAGIGGLVSAAIAVLDSDYHFAQTIPTGTLGLIVFVLTAGLSGLVGYAVKHGWITQGDVDNVTTEFRDYVTEEQQTGRHASPVEVVDATHVNPSAKSPAELPAITDAELVDAPEPAPDQPSAKPTDLGSVVTVDA